jgi:hypothetical protein
VKLRSVGLAITVLSMGANIVFGFWLLAVRRQRGGAARPVVSGPRANVGGAGRHSPAADGVIQFLAAVDGIPATREACEAKRGQFERLLSATQTEIERRLPVQTKFAKGAKNQGLTDAVLGHYRNFAAKNGFSEQVAVDCRSDFCDVKLPYATLDPKKSLDPYRWIPKGDIVMAAWPANDHGILELRNPEVHNGLEHLQSVLRRFGNSETAEQCLHDYGEAGRLVVSLSLSPPRAEIDLFHSGDLADKKTGACVLGRLAELCSENPPPTPFTSATLFTELRLGVQAPLVPQPAVVSPQR